MYTVQTDTAARTVVFGPKSNSRCRGDFPSFTFTAQQAELLAGMLRRAATALRWASAEAFAVGCGETNGYHLSHPNDHALALGAAALCGQPPAAKPDGHETWTSIRPLDTIDLDDPLLCPVCAATWQHLHT